MKKIIKIMCISIILLTTVACTKEETDKDVNMTYSVDGIVTEIEDSIKIRVLRKDEIDYEYITIEKENDITIGNYITITYDKINNGIVSNYEYQIKENAEFSGIVESINSNSAVISVDENESYILSSGDKVAVNISENKDLKIGDYVMIEYSGEIMESYPLQVNVIAIHQIMIN